MLCVIILNYVFKSLFLKNVFFCAVKNRKIRVYSRGIEIISDKSNAE